jgi:hypothetical protein
MSHLGYRVEIFEHVGYVGRTYESSQFSDIDEALRFWADEVKRTGHTDVNLIDQGIPYRQPARILRQRFAGYRHTN